VEEEMGVPSLGHLAGHGRERKRWAFNEEVGEEVCGVGIFGKD